jgi:hypothetical protein
VNFGKTNKLGNAVKSADQLIFNSDMIQGLIKLQRRSPSN